MAGHDLHPQLEMKVELAALRARVLQLEGQNLQLQRENAWLRRRDRERNLWASSAGGGAAVRRMGVLASAVAGSAPAATDVALLPGGVEQEERGAAAIGLDVAGTQLYRHAKTLIPQGCGLISKRPESFLPERWPSYYERAQGPYVWDLSGNRYMDMCNAPGPYALGAADPDVNAAVIRAVEKGVFSTLNPVQCPTPSQHLDPP
jgi:hypothetical protein|eukprot:COSAG01_NODE_457_length_16751_cov_34.906918_10_plen_204_part_00